MGARSLFTSCLVVFVGGAIACNGSYRTNDAGADGGASDDGGASEASGDDGAITEGGCGSTTTTSNCGACGRACDKTNSNGASCNGMTCSYASCKLGFADCNSAIAPNTDGCECSLPGCCGTGCATVTHSTGVAGQSFYDCVAVDTHDQAQAYKACVRFTGSMALCAVATCTVGGEAVCSSGSTTSCACWGYSGPTAGRVYNSGVAGNCGCAAAANDPTWN